MKFLIIRLSSLGDIIHTLPLVHKIKFFYPDAKVDWLTGTLGGEILSHIHEVDTVFKVKYKDIISIRKENYDLVIDVQGLFKSALLGKISNGKKLIGFKNTREFADIFYDEKINVGDLFRAKSHIVDLNLNLLSNMFPNKQNPIKFLIPKITQIKNNWLCENLNKLKKNNKLASVAIFPTTRWESKRWPIFHWIKLIEELSRQFDVYICGGSRDLKELTELFTALDSKLISYTNVVGKTNSTDLIYLIQNMDLVLGMDSFGLHLASAISNDYGKPNVIGIYGPTSPTRNGPYNAVKNCLYLEDLECISCRKKKCPLEHHKCMDEIVPNDVFKKISSLVN